MDPDHPVMEVQGMTITAKDLACYMAIIGSMPAKAFESVTRKLSDDELNEYTAAYDKAVLAYREILGRLEE